MDVTPQVPKPGWLASRPAVCALGNPARCALIVALTDQGIAQALAHGCAALQAVAAALTGPVHDTSRKIIWRFVGALPAELPDQLDGLPTLDRLLGRADRRDPLLIEQRSSGEEMEFTFHVPDDTNWFDGHFPGNPVLPGVVQLKWAIAAAREVFASGQVHAIHQLKFKAPIRPDSVISLRLSRTHAADMLRFSYRSAGVEISSGNLQWRT